MQSHTGQEQTKTIVNPFALEKRVLNPVETDTTEDVKANVILAV